MEPDRLPTWESHGGQWERDGVSIDRADGAFQLKNTREHDTQARRTVGEAIRPHTLKVKNAVPSHGEDCSVESMPLRVLSTPHRRLDAPFCARSMGSAVRACIGLAFAISHAAGRAQLADGRCVMMVAAFSSLSRCPSTC